MRNRLPDLEKTLIFSEVAIRRDKVKRHYRAWRDEQNIPYRCDNKSCSLHSSGPTWNGKELILILDHVEGNKYDNRPEMLRLLCPNCDSQLPTKGGANRGRLSSLHKQGFTLNNNDGSKQHAFFGDIKISITPKSKMKYSSNA